MHQLLARAPRLALALFSPRYWRRLSQRPAPMEAGRTHTPTSLRPAPGAQCASPWGAGMSAGANGAHAQQANQLQALPSGARRLAAPAPRALPVRVLRRHEGTAGRLAIVGRMADVCAELDRLAAREANAPADGARRMQLI